MQIDRYETYRPVSRPQDLFGPGNRIFRLRTEPATEFGAMNVAMGASKFRQARPTAPLELRLVKVENALCLPGKTIIDVANGRLLFDSLRRLSGAVDLSKFGILAEGTDWVQIMADRRTTTLKGYSLYAASRHNGYGHVLLEALSNLWALQHLPVGDMNVIANRGMLRGPFPAMLAALGIDAGQLASPHRRALLCRNLIVPSQSLLLNRAVTPEFFAIADRIAAALVADRSADERIFVSRRHVGKRKLVNEEAVEAEFARRGFRIVHPERETAAEQVRLFASASWIAGPVGSALYSAIFSAPGTRRIVLAPDRFHPAVDRLIGRKLGSHPVYMLGARVAGDRRNGMLADWSLDLDELRAALDRALPDRTDRSRLRRAPPQGSSTASQ